MEPTSVVFLSFANSEKAYLPQLKAEGRALKKALRPLEQRGFISVEKEESTSADELLELLASYKDQLCIFHYGGHAGDDLLALEGKNAQAKGLAKLLGEQKNLKLVFLNGCSTKGQVETLFEAGVKAVIATSVDVEDEQARYLAISFYQALVNKRSIKRAFEFAKSAVEMVFSNSPDIRVFRGIVMAFDEEMPEVSVPWGLYVQPEYEDEIFKWRLPYYAKQGMEDHMISYIDQHIKANRHVVMVLEEMCRYNPDIYTEMIEVQAGEEKSKDSSTFMDLIIKNFPWVIGSQLRLLLIYKEPNEDRLEQLLSTYFVCAKVLYFILLANLWKEISGMKEADKKAHSNIFVENHLLTEANLLGFDFLKGIKRLMTKLQEIEGQLFVSEFERFYDSLSSDTALSKAHAYLEDIRFSYMKLSEPETKNECEVVEEALSIVLKNAAFLANYHMLTVRNIQIDNPPFSPEAYELDLGRLNAIVNTSLRLYDDSNNRRKEAYTNCRSIVLVPNENDLRTFLNLSPFIIDKNTFLDKSAIDLFLYAFEKEGRFYYLSLNHSIFKAIANEKGTDMIHTGMTDIDFKEGWNVQRKSRRKSSRFGDHSPLQKIQEKQEGKEVFAQLESQFEVFKTDFGFV